MPTTPTLSVPSYRRRKPTGQAVVTIDGRNLYLGKWNSAASEAEYDRLIAEFLANGRRLQRDADGTVVEVLNAYRKFAEHYYRKDGRVTSEHAGIREALKIVETFANKRRGQFSLSPERRWERYPERQAELIDRTDTRLRYLMKSETSAGPATFSPG